MAVRWASMRSMAMKVLPVLVGPRRAVTGLRILLSMGASGREGQGAGRRGPRSGVSAPWGSAGGEARRRTAPPPDLLRIVEAGGHERPHELRRPQARGVAHQGDVLAGPQPRGVGQARAQGAGHRGLVPEQAALAHLVAQGGGVEGGQVPLDRRGLHEKALSLQGERPRLLEVEEVRVLDGHPCLHHHVGQGELAPEEAPLVAPREHLDLLQGRELQARPAGEGRRLAGEGGGDPAFAEGGGQAPQLAQGLAALARHLPGQGDGAMGHEGHAPDQDGQGAQDRRDEGPGTLGGSCCSTSRC